VGTSFLSRRPLRVARRASLALVCPSLLRPLIGNVWKQVQPKDPYAAEYPEDIEINGGKKPYPLGEGLDDGAEVSFTFNN
jgi:hypothetical protein